MKRPAMKPVDVRLNAIVDPERAGGRGLADLARRVAAGGATLVQLRDKKNETRPMVAAARAIKAALAPFNVPFVVNDRVDVALAAGADGVHLGPDDMAIEDARRLLGRDAIIGASIKTVAAAQGGAGRTDRLRRHRRRLCDALQGAEQRADRPGGLCRNRRRAAPARAGAAAPRHRRHRCEQRRRRDRRRRRRRRRHLGAVARAPIPAAAARGLREIVDAMLAKKGT